MSPFMLNLCTMPRLEIYFFTVYCFTVNICKIGNIYLNTSGVFDLGYTLNKEKILTFYMLNTSWKDSVLVCKLFNPETVLGTGI
jgi:hypothetical protein